MKSASLTKIMLLSLMVASTYFTGLAQEGTVETLTYFSTTQNTTCNMNIYLPPGYNEVTDTNHYPVFYLMHGGGEDYTFWIEYGLADTTLNYYIPRGIAVPMILVMPDGKNMSPSVFTQELLNDVIPYIEENYRVIADKDHRGVGGLSWGGYQSLDAGLFHYDQFGYLAILSSGWFGGDADNFDTLRTFLDENSVEMENSIRYFYFAEGTSGDLAYENGIATLAVLREYGLTVHYWEYPGGHQWTVWKKDFQSFTPYLFRDSTTVYVSLVFQGGVIKNSTVMTQKDSLAPPPDDPTRTGYTFTGWYKEPECINSFNFLTDTIRKNITIYASWEINYYHVTFNSNGGSEVPDTLVKYNTKLNPPEDPVKEGYVFDGWYSTEDLTTEWIFDLNKVKHDTTLFAKWTDVSALSPGKKTSPDIVLYPNPASSVIHISHLQPGSHIHIYNPEGRLMIQKDLSDPSVTLNIEALSEGVYIVEIRNESFINCRKLLIINP